MPLEMVSNYSFHPSASLLCRMFVFNYLSVWRIHTNELVMCDLYESYAQ